MNLLAKKKNRLAEKKIGLLKVKKGSIETGRNKREGRGILEEAQ